ncbi:cytochrome b [Pelomonas cellulosilytica]|uniref:Cytochrome b n=1 Tax=Pelomonas cellulosilytica TaxID=2906762 RepID=A0ABS8XW84_9BURK|nr:cytochrome b [Pelomonas sp. P8]MCE4554984.1 cytochrome b [Pelomonas sp. P8]
MNSPMTPDSEKYPNSMRWLHWLRAAVILGTLTVGIVMVNLPDDLPTKFESLYPNHKQFGVLALVLALAQGLLRLRHQLPAPPSGLAGWERSLSKLAHRALYVLMIVVPLMGYSMSSTFTQSDGVPFFFLGNLPELLPKNDKWFEVFQLLHRVLAYTLLALVALHVAGALKHRFLDKGGKTDVLGRML